MMLIIYFTWRGCIVNALQTIQRSLSLSRNLPFPYNLSSQNVPLYGQFFVALVTTALVDSLQLSGLVWRVREGGTLRTALSLYWVGGGLGSPGSNSGPAQVVTYFLWPLNSPHMDSGGTNREDLPNMPTAATDNHAMEAMDFRMVWLTDNKIWITIQVRLKRSL